MLEPGRAQMTMLDA